jgi:hypothetical protein
MTCAESKRIQSMHYVVILDQNHLRIYSESEAISPTRGGLQLVEAMNFAPVRRMRPNPNSDRRLEPLDGEPLWQRDAERKQIREFAAELNTFLLANRDSSWDFAAEPDLYESVMDRLLPDIQRRLRGSLSRNLADQPVTAAQEEFAVLGGMTA